MILLFLGTILIGIGVPCILIGLLLYAIFALTRRINVWLSAAISWLCYRKGKKDAEKEFKKKNIKCPYEKEWKEL